MDEQTTPKKVRRVGSIAFALVLIAAGVLLIVYQFVPQFDLLKILKFSPVILIGHPHCAGHRDARLLRQARREGEI